MIRQIGLSHEISNWAITAIGDVDASDCSEVEMVDNETLTLLSHLEARTNISIDILINKRDNCLPADKYLYRYIARKLEQCLGAIHKAQDKVNEQ
jgi:hypothetical protein